jgi:hypothetical protein
MFDLKEFIEVYGKYLWALVFQASLWALMTFGEVALFSLSVILDCSLWFVSYCYDRGITPFHLVSLFGCLAITYFCSIALVRLMNTVIVFARLLVFLSVGVKKTYPASKRFYSANFKSPLPEIRDESSFAPSALSTDVDGMPRGVVQVFLQNADDGTMLFSGHATYVDGTYKTVLHVVDQAITSGFKIFVGITGNDRSLPVDYIESTIDYENDTVELKVGATASLLGVKMLKSKFLTKGYVSIYHFDIDRQVYTVTGVVPDKYQASLGYSPFFLFTRSNTSGGDSGLPILQNGKFGACHKGAADKLKRNVHVMFKSLVLGEATKVSLRKQSVFPDVRILNEAPYADDQDDRERAEDIRRAQELQDEERREKEERMRGEHEDEEGFRKAKNTTRGAADMVKFKGRKTNWADLEVLDEADDVEMPCLKDPAQGSAIQIPKARAQSETKCSVPLKAMDEKVKESMLQPIELMDGPQKEPSSISTVATVLTSESTKTAENIVLEKLEENLVDRSPKLVPSQSLSNTSSSSDTKKISTGARHKKQLTALKQKILALELQLKDSTSLQKAGQ